MFNMPRLPEDDARDPQDLFGLVEFQKGICLPDARSSRGWWLGFARCYGQGVKDSVGDAARGDGVQTENPYPQFSPPWEAWAEGYDAQEHL